MDEVQNAVGGMATEDSRFFSRETSAGLSRERLTSCHVLVVGAGALGQYVADTLARCQMGRLTIVDFDEFEPHNATRSPFFPTAEDTNRFSGRKSPIVAHKLAQSLHFSDFPRIAWLDGPVQLFGDTLIEAADVIVSCVDNDAARNYLGKMAKRHAKPLVVGTFGGWTANCRVYGPQVSDPCWCCDRSPDAITSFTSRTGCDFAARALADRGHVPATPIVSQFTAAIVSKAVIDIVHEAPQVLNRATFVGLDLVRPITAKLLQSESCDCPYHAADRQPSGVVESPVSVDAEIGSLLDWAESVVTDPVIWLPEQFVRKCYCVRTGVALSIEQPDWRINKPPTSREEGGLWTIADGIADIDSAFLITEIGRHTPRMLKYRCADLGLAPGSLVEIAGNDRTLWARLAGSIAPREVLKKPGDFV